MGAAIMLCLALAIGVSSSVAGTAPPTSVTVERFIPLGNKGIFHTGQTPELVLGLKSGVASDTRLTLEVTVKDFWDKLASRQSRVITLRPSSGPSEHRIAVAQPKRHGFYGVTAILKQDGVQVASATSSFCVLASMAKGNPFFGTSAYGPGDPKAVRAMGAGSVGFWIAWRLIEPSKGVYDFTQTDATLQQWRDQGIRPIGFIDPRYTPGVVYVTPDWLEKEVVDWRKTHSGGFPDSYYESWRDFTRAVVTHYKDRIKTWSCYGELDLGTREEVDEFVRRYQIQAKVTKEVDPSCIIGGVGISGYGWSTAERVWPSLADCFDGQFFDPYIWPSRFGPGHSPPGDELGGFRSMLLQARDLVATYHKKILAVDEKGFAIVNALPVDSPYAKMLAKAVSRSFVIAKSVPEVDRYLYFMASEGWIEGDVDYGLWKSGSPRPSVAAYSAAAGMLMGVSQPTEVRLHKDVYLYVFKKGEGSLAALWTTLADPVRLQVKVPKDAKLHDMMGNEIPRTARNRDSLPITDSPIFLVSKSTCKTLATALGAATCSLPEVKADVRFKSLNTADLYIANQTNHALAVRVALPKDARAAWEQPTQRATIPAQQILPISLRLKSGDFLSSLNGSFSARIFTPSGGVVAVRKDTIVYPLKRMKRAAIVDGDLSKYRDIEPSFVMDGPKWIFPSGGDAIANKRWTGPDDLSMKVWLGWDDASFYFAAQVTDDQFVQENTGANIWNGNGFQLAFDTRSDAVDPKVSARRSEYGDDDYEYGIALTKDGPQAFCWHAATENKDVAGSLTKIVPAIKRVDEQTTNYEWAIPWEKLAPLKPVPGTAFGFNFTQTDPDKPGEETMCWMGLSMGINQGKNPSLFPTFFLEGD